LSSNNNNGTLHALLQSLMRYNEATKPVIFEKRIMNFVITKLNYRIAGCIPC